MLKLLIDALSIRRSKETFVVKSVIDRGYLQGVPVISEDGTPYRYFQLSQYVWSCPINCPVSSVDKHISKTGMISDETQKTLQHFMEEVVIFNNFPSVKLNKNLIVSIKIYVKVKDNEGDNKVPGVIPTEPKPIPVILQVFSFRIRIF
ncbi:MAG: hypothetical protein IPP49_20270 [Saprospiraceae bacterium]|nr:hypothetical protein [Saprospiraceae bacterium]